MDMPPRPNRPMRDCEIVRGRIQFARQCRVCKEVREAHHFPLRKWRKVRESICKACHSKITAQITIARREKLFNTFYALQSGRCGICGEEMPNSFRRGSSATTPNIDHDHSTGLIRGMLCYRCNHLLGSARDNEAILRCAIHYLRHPPASMLEAEHPLRTWTRKRKQSPAAKQPADGPADQAETPGGNGDQDE